VVIGYLLGADMERVIKLDDVGVCVRIMEVVSCAITADDDVLCHHALPIASAKRYRYFTAAMPGSSQDKRKLLTSGTGSRQIQSATSNAALR
jgi:hypothetical protein